MHRIAHVKCSDIVKQNKCRFRLAGEDYGRIMAQDFDSSLTSHVALPAKVSRQNSPRVVYNTFVCCLSVVNLEIDQHPVNVV